MIAALTDSWWIPTVFGVVVLAVGNEVSRWYRRGW
jgi:type IV secretory pathway TrbD component